MSSFPAPLRRSDEHLRWKLRLRSEQHVGLPLQTTAAADRGGAETRIQLRLHHQDLVMAGPI